MQALYCHTTLVKTGGHHMKRSFLLTLLSLLAHDSLFAAPDIKSELAEEKTPAVVAPASPLSALDSLKERLMYAESDTIKDIQTKWKEALPEICIPSKASSDKTVEDYLEKALTFLTDISYTKVIKNVRKIKMGKKNMVGKHLAGADLRDLDLTEYDFTRANLQSAALDGADCTSAKFISANLSRAILDMRYDFPDRGVYEIKIVNLTGADLTGASLHKATVRTALNAQGIILNRTDLREVNLARIQFSGIDLRGANLMNAYLPGHDLTGADLSRAVLTDAKMDGVLLNSANLTGATGYHIDPPSRCGWLSNLIKQLL